MTVDKNETGTTTTCHMRKAFLSAVFVPHVDYACTYQTASLYDCCELLAEGCNAQSCFVIFDCFIKDERQAWPLTRYHELINLIKILNYQDISTQIKVIL